MLLAGLDVFQPIGDTARFKAKLTVWLLRQPMNNNQNGRLDPTPYRNAFHLLSE